MIKRITQVLVALLLISFSFYYTNKTIELIRKTDPIMQEIKENKDKFIVAPEDAKIEEDKIIPGKKGMEIDYDKSFQKMKQYGTYNESLTVLKEVAPTISIEDNYDKFVISGNDDKKEVALVIPTYYDTSPMKILQILNQNSVLGTFFIDGTWLESNLSLVKSMEQHEVEILNYNNKYEELYFKSALEYLQNVIEEKPKYCYADYDNKEVISLCSKLKLHTVTPTIKTTSNPYQEVVDKLQNGAIISLPISTTTEKELDLVIKYIKGKGYNIVTLDKLLSENYDK